MGGSRGKTGQAALEYILVFAALMAVVGALWHFVRAARQESRRTAKLVTSEYP